MPTDTVISPPLYETDRYYVEYNFTDRNYNVVNKQTQAVEKDSKILPEALSIMLYFSKELNELENQLNSQHSDKEVILNG